MTERSWGRQSLVERVEAVGRSEAFLRFQEQLSAAAPAERPVIILGERGAGKELAASRLHYLSRRWAAPLLAVNCAALSPALVESELFGHEAGAFTGATGRRVGRFQAADGGTLFLDEAASIPLPVQEKLLRAVETQTFEPVGASRSVAVDVRLVAAFNVDPRQLVAEGRFRPDLLDRLSFEVLHAPPLRLREGDVALLARHFAARLAAELGFEAAPEFSEAALAVLESHDWPGNVRELKNVVERSVYRARGGRVEEVVLDPFVSPFESGADRAGQVVLPVSPEREQESLWPFGEGVRVNRSIPPFQEAVDALQRKLLVRALAAARHNQRRAAALLGLSYDRFRGLYRKHVQPEFSAPEEA